MTRKELDKILKVPFQERKKNGGIVFDWESDLKKFVLIDNDTAVKKFINEDNCILKCKTSTDVFYFGVGLKDCDSIIFKRMRVLFKIGKWYSYTLTE